MTKSRLIFVDLAGSVRVKKAMVGAGYQRFEELKSINLSLSALGNCIAALSKKSRHVPLRDSKLTRLLQGSLGGSSRTALVLTVSPTRDDAAETFSSLEFGQQAMQVPVRAVRRRSRWRSTIPAARPHPAPRRRRRWQRPAALRRRPGRRREVRTRPFERD